VSAMIQKIVGWFCVLSPAVAVFGQKPDSDHPVTSQK